MIFDLLTKFDISECQYSATQQLLAMSFDLSLIFHIPECQYLLRCVAICLYAFALKICIHCALRCFLD